MLFEQLSDRLGELSSFRSPVINAIMLYLDRGGLGARVVRAHNFNGTAIARAIFFDDNDAVVGLLAGANARQTDHQHRVNPLITA